MNLVTLSADSRYNPGHRYQNANVDLEVRKEVKYIKHSNTGDTILFLSSKEYNSSLQWIQIQL